MGPDLPGSSLDNRTDCNAFLAQGWMWSLGRPRLTRKSSSSPDRRKMILSAIARISLDQLAGRPRTRWPLLMLLAAMPDSSMPSTPGKLNCSAAQARLGGVGAELEGQLPAQHEHACALRLQHTTAGV